jgi:DNA-binding CsgD family transcriptional regulator
MRLLNVPWLQQIRHRTLSPREEEIVHHLANAEYPRDIAPALGITVDTVEAHCHHIRQKWQVRNQAELYQKAYLYVHAPVEVEHDARQSWVLSPKETR